MENPFSSGVSVPGFIQVNSSFKNFGIFHIPLLVFLSNGAYSPISRLKHSNAPSLDPAAAFAHLSYR